MTDVKPIDLVQLRWQQIRNFEYQRKLEIDNFKLREELRRLQDQEISFKTDSDKLKSILLSISANLRANRRDIRELKTSAKDEIASSQNLLKKTVSAFNKIKSKAFVDQDDLVHYQEDIEILRRQLAEARMSITASTKIRSDENDQIKSKLLKLQRDLSDSEREKESFRKEALTQKFKLEKEIEAKAALESKLEATTQENRTIKSTLKLLETEKQTLIQQYGDHRQKLVDSYEQMVSQSRNENDTLRSKIAELQDQLERVLAELVGKKSHFAKFVELKTENINLQSKLSTMTKKMSKSTGLLSGSIEDEEVSPSNILTSPTARANLLLKRRMQEEGQLSSKSKFLLQPQEISSRGLANEYDAASIGPISVMSTSGMKSSKFRERPPNSFALSPLASPPRLFRFDSATKGAKSPIATIRVAAPPSDAMNSLRLDSFPTDKNRLVV